MKSDDDGDAGGPIGGLLSEIGVFLPKRNEHTLVIDTQ